MDEISLQFCSSLVEFMQKINKDSLPADIYEMVVLGKANKQYYALHENIPDLGFFTKLQQKQLINAACIVFWDSTELMQSNRDEKQAEVLRLTRQHRHYLPLWNIAAYLVTLTNTYQMLGEIQHGYAFKEFLRTLHPSTYYHGTPRHQTLAIEGADPHLYDVLNEIGIDDAIFTGTYIRVNPQPDGLTILHIMTAANYQEEVAQALESGLSSHSMTHSWLPSRFG